MSGTLDEFQGWTLTIECSNCRLQRFQPVADLLLVYRGDAKIDALLSRLRCSTPGCGSPRSRVMIANRLHEVVLVGQGTYS